MIPDLESESQKFCQKTGFRPAFMAKLAIEHGYTLATIDATERVRALRKELNKARCGNGHDNGQRSGTLGQLNGKPE